MCTMYEYYVSYIVVALDYTCTLYEYDVLCTSMWYIIVQIQGSCTVILVLR